MCMISARSRRKDNENHATGCTGRLDLSRFLLLAPRGRLRIMSKNSRIVPIFFRNAFTQVSTVMVQQGTSERRLIGTAVHSDTMSRYRRGSSAQPLGKPGLRNEDFQLSPLLNGHRTTVTLDVSDRKLSKSAAET